MKKNNILFTFAWKTTAAVIMPVLALFGSQPAQAAVETWIGATNTWNTAGNWIGTNTPPISDDSLVFEAAGSSGLLLNNNLTSSSFNIAGITFTSEAEAFVIGNGTTSANVGNAFVLTGGVTNNSTSLQIINNPFSMTAAQTFTTTAGGGNITLGGVISGTGGITKAGADTLTLTAKNTYTGTKSVNEGTLVIQGFTGGPTFTAPGGDFFINNGSTLRISGGSARIDFNSKTFTFDSNGGGTLDTPVNGIGGFVFTGNNTFVTSGGAQNTISDTGGTAGGFNLNIRTAIFNVAPGSNSTSDLKVTARMFNSGHVTKTGAGTLELTGSNAYTGVTTISEGILDAATLANGGSNSAIGSSSTAAANLVLNGGTLRYSGATAASTNRNYTLTTNGGAFDASGTSTGSMTISGSMTASGTTGSQTLTLTGSGTGSAGGTLSGAVANGTGSNITAVTKQGSGQWTLSGTNTYTGATAVNGGTFIISGTGSINGTAGVTIASGATFRYSSSVTYTGGAITNNGGKITGSGNLGSTSLGGTGSIDPGNSPGILTAGSTDPTSGLDYNFEFTLANSAPAWNNAAASGNDVFRLTGGTPFTAALDSNNTISIYLASLSNGDIFTGGFYTDNNASFLSSISGADINFYLLNGSGSTTYNGQNYDLYSGPLSFNLATVAATADFGTGNVNGFTMQVTTVPEPSAFLMFSIGTVCLLVYKRQPRRKI